MVQLQFIECDQPGGRVADNSRKAVRENAMRAFRRNERLQRSKRFQEEQLRAKEGVIDAGTPPGQSLRHNSTPPNGRLDHFGPNKEGTSPEIPRVLAFEPLSSSSPDCHRLFNHCR